MKFTMLSVLSAAVMLSTACGGDSSDTEPNLNSSCSSKLTYVWDEIEVKGLRTWQCFTPADGQVTFNENCNGLPRVDYYPGYGIKHAPENNELACTTDTPATPATTPLYAWNLIDAYGSKSGQTWQCYNTLTGKRAENAKCNGLPLVDYYPND